MKAILTICSLTLLFLIATQIADADIAKPKPTATVKESRVVLHTSIEVAPDPKIYEARLQIHESDLQSLRAALDAGGNTNIAATVTRSSTRTIIAGLLMFLSLSCAGVWVARSQRKTSGATRTRKAVAAVLIGAATIGAAAIVTRGNAGPPGYFRWRTLPQSLTQGRPTSGGLDVEIIPDDPNRGGGMRLLIPSRNFAKPGEE
ncbi:MAG TPA: hypothetical protein VIG25_02940 [Pyrinomonadaceae bacterium]|jgi:hypothetical protein